MLMMDSSEFDNIDFDCYFNGTFEDGCRNDFFLDDLSLDMADAKLKKNGQPSDNNSTPEETDSELFAKRQKKMKLDRRPYGSSKQAIPGTLKSDIRRTYPLMFANTMNSTDFSLYYQFLSKYCATDFNFTQSYVEGPVPYHNHIGSFTHTPPKMIQLQGLQVVAQYWYNKMQTVPDISYTLINTKVHTWSNTECSKVVGHYIVSATKLYDVCHSLFIPVIPRRPQSQPQTPVMEVSVSAVEETDVGSKRGRKTSAEQQIKTDGGVKSAKKTHKFEQIKAESTSQSVEVAVGEEKGCTRPAPVTTRPPISAGSASTNSVSPKNISCGLNTLADSLELLSNVASAAELGIEGMIDNKVKDYLQTLPMRANPIKICCSVKLVLHLDADKKIQRMEFQVSPRENIVTNVVFN